VGEIAEAGGDLSVVVVLPFVVTVLSVMIGSITESEVVFVCVCAYALTLNNDVINIKVVIIKRITYSHIKKS